MDTFSCKSQKGLTRTSFTPDAVGAPKVDQVFLLFTFLSKKGSSRGTKSDVKFDQVGRAKAIKLPILKSMYPSPPDMTSMEEASFVGSLSLMGEDVGFRARPP